VHEFLFRGKRSSSTDPLSTGGRDSGGEDRSRQQRQVPSNLLFKSMRSLKH